MAYPQANPQPAQYGVNPAQMTVEPLALTPEETAELTAFYETLKPQAIEAARAYVLNRTPAKWQADMIDMIATDFPPPVEDPPADPVADPAADPAYR